LRLVGALAAATLVAVLAGSSGAAGSSGLAVSRLAGQSIMTGMTGLKPGAALLARIRAGQVGAVILFGRNIGTRAELAETIDALQQAAADGGNSPLLIAVDQEGGSVRRLPSGPPDLSPAEIGAQGSTATARSEGRRTAVYLRSLGIDVDLAPVLDTPYGPKSFLGTRAFSRNPGTNATLGKAFVQGLQGAGVAATAKHFPGLGTARMSTDDRVVVLTTSRRSLDARLAPFVQAIAANVDLVMVSNAGYSAYDAGGSPAVLSPAIVSGLLRGQLGYDGVVISDAMEAPGPASHADAAVRALSAGVDMLLYTNERDSSAAYAQLVNAVASGRLPPATLQSSAARIAALKSKLTHH
jgi:beta-N-acetylhexosaminidase